MFAGMAALALTWALPAFAQTAEFSVDKTRYVVPVPEGYCSTGPAIDAYFEQQRVTNPDNTPNMVLARCGVATLDAYDYFTVRVEGDDPPITHAEMQRNLREHLPAAMQAKSLVSDSSDGDFERNLGNAFGGSASVSSTVQPVGIDDFCGYTAGVTRIEIEGRRPLEVARIGCITAIGGRPVFINHFSRGADKKAAVAMLPRIKRLAESISTRED